MHGNNNGVHVCAMCFCIWPISVCVLLQGLCVRGVEHLNINNCHVGHLGPHSQLAPWAHSHHQHSCHREQERGGRYGGESGRRERDTQRVCEEVNGNGSEGNADRHEQGEAFPCSFCSAWYLPFVVSQLHLLFLVLSTMSRILPAESSASGCHVSTLDQTFYCHSSFR